MGLSVRKGKCRICISLFFLLLLAGSSSMAQEYSVRFTPKLQKAYFEIQKLRITTAKSLINEERGANSLNAFVIYLDNYADLHTLMITEDRDAYKKLSAKEDERLAAVGKLPDDSPYKRFLQAEIRLHWAFAKIKFGNEVSGAWEVIKAYKLLDENKKKFPTFLPTLKSLGFLHVLIGSVPENYTWVTRILGLRGNIELGLKELQTVMDEEPLFRQEAELMNLLLHAYTLQLDKNQLIKIKQLAEANPDNLLLHFFAATTLMKEARSKDAEHMLQDAPTGPAYIAFPFLDYLRGEIALQAAEYDKAFIWYSRFLSVYRGFNYIKDSNLKMFMCRWLAGRDTEARTFIGKIKSEGSAVIEADKLAIRAADDYTSGKMAAAQKVLYKSRYATDGGFLNKAMESLDGVAETNFTTLTDKAEFNYRKGRILQKADKEHTAIPFFTRCVNLTKGASIGFGASSALQLGYIYKETGQRAKAIEYFRIAMSYNKYEYKNSIDSKARAALTSLGV